jgi:hypothetical protein
MVDIPFVSENFQRSYRNRFPSQTSTGRDLHVSDVVIPVVDFTPTAVGTSLDLNLRRARSTNTSRYNQSAGSASYTDFISQSGFYLIQYFIQLSGSNVRGEWGIFLNDGTTPSSGQIAGSYLNLNQSTNQHMVVQEEIYTFVPQGYFLKAYFSEPTGSDGEFTIYSTQVADVNGNEQLPPLYSPQ